MAAKIVHLHSTVAHSFHLKKHLIYQDNNSKLSTNTIVKQSDSILRHAHPHPPRSTCSFFMCRPFQAAKRNTGGKEASDRAARDGLVDTCFGV